MITTLFRAALLVCLGSASMFADSYQVFQILSRTGEIDALAPALKDPKLLGSMIDGQNFVLKEFTVVEVGADGVGLVDQTYPLKYAQSYADDGTPQEFATRKVGIYCRIEKQSDGTVELRYDSTVFDQWLFHGNAKQFMQPLFTSRAVNTRIALAPGEYVIGGQFSKRSEAKIVGQGGVNKSSETSVLIIRRI